MNKKDKEAESLIESMSRGLTRAIIELFAAIVFIILEIYSVCLMPVKSLSMLVISILSGCVVLAAVFDNIKLFTILLRDFKVLKNRNTEAMAVSSAFQTFLPLMEYNKKVSEIINSGIEFGCLVEYTVSNTSFVKKTGGELNYIELMKKLVAAAQPESDVKYLCGFKSENEFYVFYYSMDYSQDGDAHIQACKQGILTMVNNSLTHMKEIADGSSNISGGLDVHCGYSLYPAHTTEALTLIFDADFAVSEAVFFNLNNKNEFSNEAFKKREDEYKRIGLFNTLMKKNLFIYNYQPIVDAHTGAVFAYEALMRTASNIGMNPMEVLDVAAKQNRLYDIEKVTFFNGSKPFIEKPEIFKNRKLFINSIPNAVMNDEDFEGFLGFVGDSASKIVIEITEEKEESSEALAALSKAVVRMKADIALDDYGSGYSNTGNLLNYNPSYLKIDRSLITAIDTDIRKQHLVSNIISFAKQHNIVTIAEGVETYDEMGSVIRLGVDLIQGFYTGRPESELVEQIPEAIKEAIIKINLDMKDTEYTEKSYGIKKSGYVELLPLMVEKYNLIEINSNNVTLSSNGYQVDLAVRIPENFNGHLELDNVNIKGKNGPAITLGENVNLTLGLVGNNVLSYEGIRVPVSSKLVLIGDGNLTVKAEHNNGIGIGGTYGQHYGKIYFSSKGNVSISTNGDNAVAVGGIGVGDYSEIKFLGGRVSLNATGINAIAAGSFEGFSKIQSNKECNLTVSASGTNAVGIGTFSGDVDIQSESDISLKVNGEQVTAIGSMNDGTGHIDIISGNYDIRYNAMNGAGIGSVDGSVDVKYYGDNLKIYAEGTNISGIGNYKGSGKIEMLGGNVDIDFLAANPIAIGNSASNVLISGGNIKCDLKNSAIPVNQFGEQLKCVEVNAVNGNIDEHGSFIKNIKTLKGEYTYIARKTNMFAGYYVYLPEDIINA